MSKPVTNVEIEDVLSSIRRLVSSSDRAERSEDAPRNEAADKLVLTPALRVDEAFEKSDEVSENQQDRDETSSDEFADDMAAVDAAEDAVDADEAASDGAFLEYVARSAESRDDSDAPDGDEAAATDVPDLSDGDDALASLDDILQETADNSPDFDAAEAQDLADDEAADAGDARDNLQRRAAEFETLIAERDDAWDPDGTTQDDNAAHSVGPVPWDDDDSDIDTAAPDAGAGDDDAPDMAEAFRHGAEVDEAEEEPAAETADAGAAEAETGGDETAGEDTTDAPTEPEEPDLAQVLADAGLSGMDEDEFGDETTEAPDASEADEPDEAPGPAEEAFEPEPAAFAFRSHMSAGEDVSVPQSDADRPVAAEEALLDEEALRDMVSDIVRQELQGALGERITRNVRKLVRREIHRALASQELE